ncbi:hypothetical protein E2C01_042003 [Portunus trituberculatus]|uniref:Uncharacterized protein n=1 Tax=Portunus trituberculatus TaxID=210409 RepID=A0A5B7FS73_PORTR|nr:hypothetical protein [Portunus trituberculatus]
MLIIWFHEQHLYRALVINLSIINDDLELTAQCHVNQLMDGGGVTTATHASVGHIQVTDREVETDPDSRHGY